jgi:AraC-like DNA-binding protein
MSGRLLPMTKEELEKIAVDNGFDPAEMAKALFISLREMERHFARHLGSTSNKEIAAKLKFADESRFCHVFKKYCEISPQTFATQCRREGGIVAPAQ